MPQPPARGAVNPLQKRALSGGGCELGPAHSELAEGWAGEPSPEDSGKRAWKRGARPLRAPRATPLPAPARPTWGRLQVISSRNWASGVEKLEKSEESEAGKAASRKSSLAGARILGTPGAHLQPVTRCRTQPSGRAAPEGRANRPRAVPLARAHSPGPARPPGPPAPLHPQQPPARVHPRPVAPVTVVPATNQARRSWSRGRMAPPPGAGSRVSEPRGRVGCASPSRVGGRGPLGGVSAESHAWESGAGVSSNVRGSAGAWGQPPEAEGTGEAASDDVEPRTTGPSMPRCLPQCTSPGPAAGVSGSQLDAFGRAGCRPCGVRCRCGCVLGSGEVWQPRDGRPRPERPAEVRHPGP